MSLVLLACSGGGHLKELLILADSIGIAHEDRIWFTTDSALSRSVLRDQLAVFLPYVRPRSLIGTFGLFRNSHSLFNALDIRAVVSTGAIPGLAALSAATQHGIPGHYIESVARVSAPSVTGRLVSKIPKLHLYSQYDNWKSPRWHYRGSIFDRFQAAPDAVKVPSIRRAVVTVGTTEGYSFRRLYERLVPLLSGVDVLWQTGSDDVAVFGIDGRPRVDHAELHHAMVEADVIIAHAGTGSALSALEAGKRPVLVARRKHLHEHVDDHQLQVAKELAERGLAVISPVNQLQYSDLIAAAATQIYTTEPRRFMLD